MNKDARKLFDLARPAENGMRRGFTTGACAAAAVKAAVQLLQFGETSKVVHVSLPDGEHFLTIPVHSTELTTEKSARAEVIKDAGDDPDNTDGATIFAIVKKNGTDKHKFLSGRGVGTVTQPGIRVPVGQPAINPAPRLMIHQAIQEVYEEEAAPGFDITIGCLNGEEIAKRTFNPRLGIKNGISILGTTGIVEPFSMAAYVASIEVYIRVALGDDPCAVAFMPGNIGINYCRDFLNLSQSRSVHISNFIGFAVDQAQQILEQEKHELAELWLLGHPGKLAKLLDQQWDTHSSKSSMAMPALARAANSFGLAAGMVEQIAQSNTVEAIVELLTNNPAGKDFWSYVEAQIAEIVAPRVPAARAIKVRLFSMNGTALGRAIDEVGQTSRRCK